MGDVSIEPEASYDVPMDPIMEREASEEKETVTEVLFPTVSGIDVDASCKESKPDINSDDDKSDLHKVMSASQQEEEVKTNDSNQSPRATLFDWHSYLEKTNSLPAPPECFFHSRIPPENLFQADMKLMITDPRGPTGSDAMYCLGTIIQVYSVWICVRLEGLDNTNDRWIMCDDVNIKPIRPDKRDHKDMNPPIGFIYHHGNFPKWLEQQLKPDEDTGKDRICPPEWFRPISKSLRPPRNLFEVGMKVEAIDQKSFNGKPSPATIVESTKDFIKVNFDGWNSAYDIREPFYSRYIMPVGWSEMVGVEILPPKAIKIKAKVTVTANVKKHRPALVVGCASTSKQRDRDRRRISLPTNTIVSSSQSLLKRLSDIGAKPTTIVRRGRGRPPKRARVSIANTQSNLDFSVPENDFAVSSSNEDRSINRYHASDKSKVKQEKESAVEEKVREILRDAKAEEALQLSSPQTIQKKLTSPSPLPKSSIILSPSRVVHSPPGPPPPIPKRSPDTATKTFTSRCCFPPDHSLSVPLPSTFIPVVATTTNSSQSNKFTIPVFTSAGNGGGSSQLSNLRPIAPRPPGMTSLPQNSSMKRRTRQPTLPVKIMKDLLRLPPEARSQLIDPESVFESAQEASGVDPEHIETPLGRQLSNGAVSPRLLVGHNTASSPRTRATDFVFVCDDELPQNERTMCLYVNPECHLGPLLDPRLVREMRPCFGPYSMHHVLREAVQQLINSSFDQGKVYSLTVPSATAKIISITAEFGGVLHSRFLPCASNAKQAWRYLKELLNKMGTCENFYSSTSNPCQLCTGNIKEDSREELTGPSHSHQLPRTNKHTNATILEKPIASWSIDKVASELRKIFDESIVEKFVINQIDGRALLLLKPELLMKHMDMAFGPALKVVGFVDSIKEKQKKQREA